MPRFAICPLTTSVELGWHAAIIDNGQTNAKPSIPTDEYGAPLYLRCFVAFETGNFTAVEQTQNTTILPEYSLDGRLDGMNPQARADMVQNLEAVDWTGQGFYVDADTPNQDASSYGQFLMAILAQLVNDLTLSDFLSVKAVSG